VLYGPKNFSLPCTPQVRQRSVPPSLPLTPTFYKTCPCRLFPLFLSSVKSRTHSPHPLRSHLQTRTVLIAFFFFLCSPVREHNPDGLLGHCFFLPRRLDLPLRFWGCIFLSPWLPFCFPFTLHPLPSLWVENRCRGKYSASPSGRLFPPLFFTTRSVNFVHF